MDQKRLEYLLNRFLVRMLSQEEADELEKFLLLHPSYAKWCQDVEANKDAIQRIVQEWDSPSPATNRALDTVIARIREHERFIKRRNKILLYILIGVIIIILILFKDQYFD